MRADFILQMDDMVGQLCETLEQLVAANTLNPTTGLAFSNVIKGACTMVKPVPLLFTMWEMNIGRDQMLPPLPYPPGSGC